MVFLNTIKCGLEPNYLEHLSFTFNTFYIVFNQGTLISTFQHFMTRKIAQWLGEVQYMLKQGSSWHDITDYYRARKKAVNLKAETVIRKSCSPQRRQKGKSHRKRNRFKRNLLKCKRPYQVRNLKYS